MKNIDTIKGYKINYSNNTITMNFKFAKAAQIIGSPEYTLLVKLKSDYPTIKTVVASGRKKTKASNRRLTYAHIEQHLSQYSNSEELLEEFEIVKKLSQPLASPYKYVCDWFLTAFPDYENVMKSLDNCKYEHRYTEIPDTQKYKKKLSRIGKLPDNFAA